MSTRGHVVFAYVPVLHAGYREFFLKNNRGANRLFIFSEELIAEFPHLRKDLRALSPSDVAYALEIWGFHGVMLADRRHLKILNDERERIVMPDEDICREVAEKYLGKCDVVFDTSVFLRWDSSKALDKRIVDAHEVVEVKAADRALLHRAQVEAQRSWDWWRQVGALVARDGTVLYVSHNKHVPSEYILPALGDPRGNFKKGVHIELSTALHAEAAVIARAARDGVALEGTDLYVTTFPCPPCAKLVAESGISRLFFAEGYAMMEGDELLKAYNVRIIRVADPGE